MLTKVSDVIKMKKQKYIGEWIANVKKESWCRDK